MHLLSKKKKEMLLEPRAWKRRCTQSHSFIIGVRRIATFNFFSDTFILGGFPSGAAGKEPD